MGYRHLGPGLELTFLALLLTVVNAETVYGERLVKSVSFASIVPRLLIEGIRPLAHVMKRGGVGLWVVLDSGDTSLFSLLSFLLNSWVWLPHFANLSGARANSKNTGGQARILKV